MRKPRVLVIYNRYQQAGGEDTAVHADIAVLRQNGHDVVEYGRDNASIADWGLMRKASLLVTTTWNQRTYDELRQLVRAQRPEVAHCHNLVPLASPAAYYACQAEGISVVQTLHNFRLWCPASTHFRSGAVCNDCGGGLRRAIVQGCYRNSRLQTGAVAAMLGVHRAAGTFHRAVDLYSAPSTFCMERAAAAGIPRDKIVVRPNFLLHDPEMRQADGGYVAFVGRLCEEKGVRQLLEAWRPLGEIPLRVVGDGPLRKDAQEHAPRNVRFTGALSRSDALAQIKGARFLVFPSIAYETFGMTALEAAACGVATVGSRLGAIPELIEDGRSGLLFDPHDIDDMVAKVRWAWSHPIATNELGVTARRRYLKHYTAERGYESLMQLYCLVSESFRMEGRSAA